MSSPQTVAIVSTFKNNSIFEHHVLRHTFYRKKQKINLIAIKLDKKNAKSQLQSIEKKVDCILPNGVEANFLCAKHIPRSSKLIVSTASMYEKLDDKAKFIKLNMPSHTITQIPSLALKTASKKDVARFIDEQSSDSLAEMKFLVKPTGAEGGEGLKIKGGNAMRKINLSKHRNYVLQPFFEDIKIFGFSFFAMRGKLMRWQLSIPDRELQTDAYDDGFHSRLMDSKRSKSVREMHKFVSKCVKKWNLGGIMEFEFVKSEADGRTHIMEVNPRIAGNLFDRTKSWHSPYAENLVLPYIESVLRMKPFRPLPKFKYFPGRRVYCDPDGSRAWKRMKPY